MIGKHIFCEEPCENLDFFFSLSLYSSNVSYFISSFSTDTVVSLETKCTNFWKNFINCKYLVVVEMTP